MSESTPSAYHRLQASNWMPSADFAKHVTPSGAHHEVFPTPVRSFALHTGKPAQQQGAISFVTGGIGSDEAQAFRSAAAQYNLRLTLAAVSGEFFAGVRVTLRDAQGNTVVEAVSDGPYLFLNVPPGRYQVTADNLGQVQRRNALVRTKGATELYLRWKTTTEQ
jgi:hypothetical protein